MIQVRTPQSSNIQMWGYDWTTHQLTVQFKSGKAYRYKDVPAEKVHELSEAESVGSFIAKQIVPVFEAVKVEPEEEGE